MRTDQPADDNRAFYLLSEQIGRLAEELIATRESHFALVEKFGQQSVLLAKLAERIDMHNRLIEERKSTDHNRIAALEVSHSMLSVKVDEHEKWKWRLLGLVAGLVLGLELLSKLAATWIT